MIVIFATRSARFQFKHLIFKPLLHFLLVIKCRIFYVFVLKVDFVLFLIVIYDKSRQLLFKQFVLESKLLNRICLVIFMQLRRVDGSEVLIGEKWNWKIGLHLNILILSQLFKQQQCLNIILQHGFLINSCFLTLTIFSTLSQAMALVKILNNIRRNSRIYIYVFLNRSSMFVTFSYCFYTTCIDCFWRSHHYFKPNYKYPFQIKQGDRQALLISIFSLCLVYHTINIIINKLVPKIQTYTYRTVFQKMFINSLQNLLILYLVMISKELKSKSEARVNHHKTSKNGSSRKSQANDHLQTVVFLIVSDQEGAVSIPYQFWADPIKKVFKDKGAQWCTVFKVWKMDRVQMEYLKRDLPKLLTANYEQPPNFVRLVAQPLLDDIRIGKHQYRKIQYDIRKNKLYDILYPFQRETLDFCIVHHGRILIADEMGVGKSLQSLACCTLYTEGFPLLIICPSALKNVWRDEVLKWLKDYVEKSQVLIIKKGLLKEGELSSAKVVVTSYQIAIKLLDQLSQFKTVICDEAHYLKNPQTARCSQLIPFLQNRRRIMLLTGTPALAKPKQLYNLLTILRPDIFTSLQDFGVRYCYRRRNPWSHKLQYDGAKNLAELHYILKKTVMIRRLKQQVLPQLPSKQRQIILMQTEKAVVSQIKKLLQTKVSLNDLRSSDKLVEMFKKNEQGEYNQIMRCYMLSAVAKLNSIKQYIAAILQNDVKIIVFVHHKVVMDDIEAFLKTTKVQYVRMDGDVSPQTRKKKVDQFQEQSIIKVALLSMTAMGVGFTLTAASTVLFAELHWTPAVLIQAEDRTHRIGQKKAVNIHYLIGDETLDALMLRQLERKVGTVAKVLDGQDDNLNIQILPKGELGNFTVTTQQKSVKGQKITDYFAPIKQSSRNEQKEIEDQAMAKAKTQSILDEKEQKKRRIQAIIKEIAQCSNSNSDESAMLQFLRSKRKSLKKE